MEHKVYMNSETHDGCEMLFHCSRHWTGQEVDTSSNAPCALNDLDSDSACTSTSLLRLTAKMGMDQDEEGGLDDGRVLKLTKELYLYFLESFYRPRAYPCWSLHPSTLIN